jgi:hypothetical protein
VTNLGVGGAYVRLATRPDGIAPPEPARLTLIGLGEEVPTMDLPGAVVYVRPDGYGLSFDQAEQVLIWAHVFSQ